MIRRKRNVEANRGSAMTELIVATTLLLTALSLLGNMAFRTGKLWQDTRHHRLAMNELINQLEHLTTLDESKIDEQLAKLTVSEAVQNVLPSPKLAGRKLIDDFGTRVVLEIEWDRLGKAEPLSLVGWIAPTEGEP